MNHKQPAPVRPFRLQLLDVSALVVGYGMAAVLFRAFLAQDGRLTCRSVCSPWAFTSGWAWR